MKKIIVGVVAIIAVVVVVIIVGSGVSEDSQLQSGETVLDDGCISTGEAVANRSLESCDIPNAPQSKEDEASSEDDSEETAEPQTEEEKREAEEEKKVNAFDDLTDKWMEPSAKGVTMADIDNFAKSFRQIPKSRQDECIHRALNLIPDENVMLLAGILMDKSMDKEIIETVYNDILNRDEDVKKPILQQIFKDKSHPCWADTAWILDVTGELPKK